MGERQWSERPPGSFYLRYSRGSKPIYTRVGTTYDEACVAKVRLERKLRVESDGGTLPEEPNATRSHRCTEVLDAYLESLRNTTKRNGRRYGERSIKSRKSEILAFLKFSGAVHVEQITRGDIIKFKESLYQAGKASDTVLNKMMQVVTWLKRNPVVSIVGLVKGEDWPEKRVTRAHPYRENEIKAMLAAAKSYEETLLLRLLHATGMREGEVTHLEFEDLDNLACCVHIRNKPNLNWETKTTASVRYIPLDPDLIAELRTLGKTGLVFRSKTTGHIARIDRVLERIGKDAGYSHPWMIALAGLIAGAILTPQIRSERSALIIEIFAGFLATRNCRAWTCMPNTSGWTLKKFARPRGIATASVLRSLDHNS